MHRIGRRIAVATLFLGLSFAGNAAADILDLFSWDVPFPAGFSTGSLTSFTVVLQGNVLSSIDTSSTLNDPALNPYLYLNNLLGYGSTSLNATLDGNGNTDVTFSGSNGITAADSGDLNDPGSAAHFGLDQLGPQSLTDLGSFWTDTSNTTYALPDLSVIAPAVPSNASNVQYVTFFADVTSGGNTVGEWFEIPYSSPTPPSVLFNNPTNAPVTLSDAKYFISPTEIPLDNLNLSDEPPQGSPFIPLPGLDGVVVPAGGSVVDAPEPSSFLSALGAGIAGMLAISMRRKQ